MSRRILNSIVFVILVLAGAGCKTRKAIVKAPVVSGSEKIDVKRSENIKMLRDNDMSFNTLSLKARANLDINGNGNNVTMNIRIEKNKRIWASITAFAGIEVARALITPDSLKVRNNLQGVYLKKPFNYIHTFTGKQVNFQLLESILVGNTISDLFDGDAELEQANGVWELRGMQEDLSFKVLFNTLLKVGETDLNNVKSGQALKVIYGDYQKINDTLFPSSAKINSVSGTKRISIDLDFSKIERNVPLDFPFNVPGRYEVIN